MLQIPRVKNLLIPVYVASLFYSFHYALPLYIDSSFIAESLPSANIVGSVFAVAAFFAAVTTFLYPRILRRFGNYRTILTTMSIEVAALVALAIFSNPIIVISVFVIHQIMVNVIYLNLDTFIESFSDESQTGGIRGTFLTIVNGAILVAPFVAGLLLTDHDFWKIYLLAAFVMALGIVIIVKNFKNYIDPHYIVPKFKETFLIVARSHDLHSIIFMHFLLAFFFSWMVIYTPIYLNQYMNIPMSDILTVIIPITLLPFIFFEVFLGKIADTRLGEKEILTAGFILMALSTMSLSFVTTSNIFVWAGLFFVTRTGASAVEIMTETYFYKQVKPEDVHLITFMRTIRSLAYMMGPLVGLLVLSFTDYRNLFMVLGVIMLAALPYSLTIKDSR